jgi:hypothetical protein
MVSSVCGIDTDFVVELGEDENRQALGDFQDNFQDKIGV